MELIRRVVEPECASTKARCICMLSATHEGAHVCECEGSWDDEGNVFAFPSLVVEDGMFPKGSRPFDLTNRSIWWVDM